MRQIFTSARLETVEGVARLLEENGIASRIRNGRSYKGSYSRGFSYRDAPGSNQPALWVVHPDDYSKARSLLREAGLLEPGPQSQGSFVSGGYASPAADAPRKKIGTPARIRAVLLIGIAAVLVMTTWWQHQQKSAAPATQERSFPLAGSAVKAPETPAVYIVETPPALAQMLMAKIAAEHGIRDACLMRDGEPVADKACDSDGNLVHIRDYRTDGSGSGEVDASWRSGGKEQQARYRVRREGHDWQVVANEL